MRVVGDAPLARELRADRSTPEPPTRPLPPDPAPATICRSLDKRRARHPPAVVHVTEPLELGDARLVEEHLVELDLAADVPQRAHLDARLVHVDRGSR